MLYLDTSALAKLVILGAETTPLRAYLAEHEGVPAFASALVAAELPRAAHAAGDAAASTTRTVLDGLHLVDVTRGLIERAGALRTRAPLSALDAIHLVTAMTAQHRLVAVVTYDASLAAAATELGLAVASP